MYLAVSNPQSIGIVRVNIFCFALTVTHVFFSIKKHELEFKKASLVCGGLKVNWNKSKIKNSDGNLSFVEICGKSTSKSKSTTLQAFIFSIENSAPLKSAVYLTGSIPRSIGMATVKVCMLQPALAFSLCLY